MHDTIFRQLTAIGADVFAVLLYTYGIGFLVTRFQEKTPWNGVLIGLVYAAFCISVYYLLKLPPAGGDEASKPGGFIVLTAACFGAMVGFMIAESSGLIGYIDQMDTGAQGKWTSLIAVAGVIIFVGVLMAYPMVLSFGGKHTTAGSSGSTWMVEVVALLGINLMIVVMAGHWDAYFADTEPYESITVGAKILIFLATFAFFYFFVASPRLVYVMRRPGWIATVTFLLQTGWYVWHSLVRHAWR